MKESDSKPYLIGLAIFIVITTILLLIEWYITAFVVFMAYIGIHMLICLDDLYPHVTKKETTPQTQRCIWQLVLRRMEWLYRSG